MGKRTVRTLTHEEARAFYDNFGRKQDLQGFYEEPALKVLVAKAALGEASSLVEFGCGTGRLALELLQRHLPKGAQYLGTDISSTMVAIASDRLASFASRASVLQTQGEAKLPAAAASVDRVLSAYVFDLLSDADREEFLAEAQRVLRVGGLLCLCGITEGATLISRAVMSGWGWLYAHSPRLVGGCRPTRAAEFLQVQGWRISYQRVVIAWGVASEVVIASPHTNAHA
jgi:ubiquinone/menaquinone biosynthesis C-methylase UbiE